MIKTNYLEMNLKWNDSGDPEYPRILKFNNQTFQIRINDFPEEPLYTLIIDGKEIIYFNNWPKNWEGE